MRDAIVCPIISATLLVALCTCATSPRAVDEVERRVTTPPDELWPAVLDGSQRVAAVTGFSGPESVRYDPNQDVYFVGNFNSSGMELGNAGFITRMRPDGVIDELRFIAGGENDVTLHAPRGMTIVGDTLWAVDVDGVRGFHRATGAAVATVDLSGMDVGFLNDVAAGPDGALYVTDTNRNRIYRISGREVIVALADTALGQPNGITWDAVGARFIVVPYGGGNAIFGWRPGTTTLEPVGTSSGARFDGVEVLAGGRILVASQADSSIHLFFEGEGRPFIRTAGRPADIALDTRRLRVAVPFISLNQVELWQLPRE